jgi:flagellar hook-associated protein 1 FlgK
MTLTLALKTALTGIQTSQAALQVNANNIANVNTEGFSRKIVELSPRRLGSTGAGVEITDISRRVNQFLVNQVRRQSSDLAAVKTRESTLAQLQGLFGTPNSNDNFAASLTALNNKFEALALAPESEVARFDAVNEGRKLTNQLAQLSELIQNLRAEADQAISAGLITVNQQLQAIGRLNATIAQASTTGQPQGELRDLRDTAVGKIAEFIDIRVFESGNGRISIFTGTGRNLLSEGTIFTLTHTAASQTDASIAFVKPGDSNFPGPITGIFVGTPDSVNGTNDITTQISGGEFKGLIDTRDAILPNLQRELDRMTSTLTTRINALHNQGTAFPPPGTLTGSQTFGATDAFTGTGSVRIAVLDKTTGAVIEFTDINLGGLGATATVSDVVSAINAGLSGTPASIDAKGKLVIQAQSANQGIAINENTSAVTVIGGVTRGFSHFFGLNDFLVSDVDGSDYNTFASGPQSSSTAALGLTGTLTFRFDGTAGTTVAYTSGQSLETIAASINANTTLAAQNITATVSDDSTGRRLTIRDTGQDNFIIADSSTLLSGTNFTPDETSVSTVVTVSSDIANDSDRIARGRLNLTAAVGDTGISVGDGTVANSIAGLFSTNIAFVQSGDISAINTTLINFASQILSVQASLAANAQSELAFNETFFETLLFRQQNISSVNVDEELADLVLLENAFSASARVLSVISELLDILINSVR